MQFPRSLEGFGDVISYTVVVEEDLSKAGEVFEGLWLDLLDVGMRED